MRTVNQIQITKAGFESLKKELEELTETKRPRVVDRLSNARLQGDLAENSDYHNAKDELEFLDGRISELEEVIKSAVVVSHAKGGGISLGTIVTLKVDGKQMVYEIVGEWEADPMKKKLSHTSPLGKALVGKKIGDKVDVEAPAGKLTYEVLTIE
jgi:transcription elongation factor GreA